MHIEGTFEPELIFEIAKKNGVDPGYPSPAAARAARDFKDLQDFLDMYYKACDALLTRDDFKRLGEAYLRRAAAGALRQLCAQYLLSWGNPGRAYRGVSAVYWQTTCATSRCSLTRRRTPTVVSPSMTVGVADAALLVAATRLSHRDREPSARPARNSDQRAARRDR